MVITGLRANLATFKGTGGVKSIMNGPGQMETIDTDSVMRCFSARPTLDPIQQSPGGYVTGGVLPLPWLLQTLGFRLTLGGVSKAETGLVRQDGNSSGSSPS